MSSAAFTLSPTSPDQTADLAARLGQVLTAGDTVLLDGPIGAGKTHFCRHLIQSLLDAPEDVPSPTFTLVQTYDTSAGEIWHADLYRLGDVGEVEELGLFDAFDQAICLIEWPDRLGDAAPRDALTVTMCPDPQHNDTRRITFDWTDPKWDERLENLTHD